MAGIESLLPAGEAPDNMFAAELKPLIHDELEALKADSLFGDVIDWTLIQGNIEEVSDGVAALMGYDTEDEKESMVRGMLFARQVVAMVYGYDIGVHFPPYLSFDTENTKEQIRDWLHNDTQDYLAARPNVDELIRQFMADIDGGRTYPHRAKTAAALIFMSAETWLADRYLVETANQLEPEDFER